MTSLVSLVDTNFKTRDDPNYPTNREYLRGSGAFEREIPMYAKRVSGARKKQFQVIDILNSLTKDEPGGDKYCAKRAILKRMDKNVQGFGCPDGGDCLNLYEFGDGGTPEEDDPAGFYNQLMYFTAVAADSSQITGRYQGKMKCVCAAHILMYRMTHGPRIVEGGLYNVYNMKAVPRTKYSLYLTILGNPRIAELRASRFSVPATTPTSEQDQANLYEKETECGTIIDEADIALLDNKPGELLRGGGGSSFASVLTIAFLGAVTVAASLCRRP